MPRFIADIEVSQQELDETGFTVEQVAAGIHARLYPVVSCDPDETLSTAVTVSVTGVSTAAAFGDIATAQGWSDETMLDLALEYISNQQSDDAFNDFLQEKADEENNA